MALGLTPYQIIEKGTHPQLVIADEWERVELKKIASVQNGYAFSSKLFNRTEGMPLIRIRDIFSVETENFYLGEYNEDFVVNKGDIIIGMDGDFKVSKWPGNKGLLNQRVCRIHFNSAYYEKAFLFICIQPYLNAIHSETSAVTVKHLSSRTISDIPFPLPPLPIQRAIVAKIEELFSDLDKGIADLKKAQDQLKIYRQAVLKKAFEGELTKEWRNSNTYTMQDFLQKLKLEKLKAIKEKLIPKGEYFPKYESKDLTYNPPQNWITLPWKTLCANNKYAMKRGPFGSALKKEFFVEKGIVVYEQGHAINDEPYRHRYYITNEKFKELKAFETKAGDMIISCSGVTLGRICLLPEDADIGVINQALLKIDMDESIMLKRYFIQLFRSGSFQRLIFQKSLGSAMPNMVGMAELKEIPIPIPPIEEQHQILKEIESRLSVCYKVEESITESLEKAKALRQSILKKAFEGTLLSTAEIAKCKQAEDYEPASVLLAKIKKEKS
ncbi:restriction endonuclease subunit S [Roseivirga sp.]|uniref:restriction endonuclease subunit S n=1 Tax=Roseivirga sp. TaxID=1964215 RepID=UPI002B269560|nr:restriction endonuclease subunit S [Roseivirga sp.]